MPWMISSLFNQAIGIRLALKAFRNEHGTLTQPTPALATVTATSMTLSGGEVPFLSRCTKPKASGFHLGKPARRERYPEQMQQETFHVQPLPGRHRPVDCRDRRPSLVSQRHRPAPADAGDPRSRDAR